MMRSHPDESRVDTHADMNLEHARSAYGGFIDKCRTARHEFRLTPKAEPSPYALCFGIFGLHLLKAEETIAEAAHQWDVSLRRGLDQVRNARQASGALHRDKDYLQLLTFTLSALSVLGTLRRDPLRDHVEPLLAPDLKQELTEAGSLRGLARSGNHAMFLAILLLHARDYLALPVQARLHEWVSLHRGAMNARGFWGARPFMSHLQFQNGYHQYEIFEYLQVHDVPWQRAAASVASLADPMGHFAPYPGGGGCYDYDAVFMLTADGTASRHRELLLRTAQSILAGQNADGGFAESHYVRPLTAGNLRRMLRHVVGAPKGARAERARLAAALLRPRHRRIHTHWSRYSRQWNESNLWDSWFRMLALARIEVAFDPAASSRWGFMSYPGIGYHPAAPELQTTS
jgi:hypothetical protein